MKIDFHTHSHFSDGSHPPEWVVERAVANGVQQLALTDHDCLEGFLAASKERPRGIALIAGVEISTLWENLEIHVLGLSVDPTHPALCTLLEDQQARRRNRLAEINLKLIKAGLTGFEDYLQSLPCVAPGRAHVARFLATQTHLGSPKKAFKTLARNGRFFVRAEWCSMNEAVSTINAAGGIAVLAHPHRYPTGKSASKRLLRQFKEAGGEALEVCCSNMTRDTLEHLTGLSLEYGFWVSAGSDFHSSEANWMDIGRLAGFPEVAKKNAIWLHPRWHCEDSGLN